MYVKNDYIRAAQNIKGSVGILIYKKKKVLLACHL